MNNTPLGKRKRADAPGAVTSESSVFRNGAAVETKTIGWIPSCGCGLANTEPCTVLDCFGGTTGKVALQLGRRAILIELNPEYCQQIVERCKEGLQEPAQDDEVRQRPTRRQKEIEAQIEEQEKAFREAFCSVEGEPS